MQWGMSGSSAAIILAFDARNRLAVRTDGGGAPVLPFTGGNPGGAEAALTAVFGTHTPLAEFFSVATGGREWRVFFSQVSAETTTPGNDVVFFSIEKLEPAAAPGSLLAAVLAGLGPHLIAVPYLHLGENDFIYKFRPAQERNAAIYAQDAASTALYQSRLCAAIKALARQHERSATAPVALDFGAVRYVVPSHFGFCLGVKNAIERAYETLAENPGRRVFMLSELIHNPFVNEDLLRRGLRYLQTDKGEPYNIEGNVSPVGCELVSQRGATSAPPTSRIASPPAHVPPIWDTLTPDDIVIIPAFGATDDDKRRLVRKGIAVCQYDATCMLVEKVWKAARAYGREGYTVVIHGKHEHEETKATFSNTRRHAHAVIVRNLDEARQLGDIIATADPAAAREKFSAAFAGRHTPGLDPAQHLGRIAVVNQTTLLMNETLEITEHLRGVFRARLGDDSRVGGSGRRDTLCYATQVNQDALSRALAEPLDAAFVIGGRNSSNTYQLFRLCEQRLGARAFFIQSEANIRSRATVDHYLYVGGGAGRTEPRPLWPELEGKSTDLAPKRVLVTGGASCPDGIIQQVVARLNALFPPDRLRPVEAVLADLSNVAVPAISPAGPHLG
jgi:4-hydroxy-3-methylbut-2-enyl diphosphate reductase